jgi:D-serine deaminase-like pyridoxal phosphate-dependent protein
VIDLTNARATDARTLADLDTPSVVIDLDIVERNVLRWQERCDRLGLANRPHIKTHKLVPLARHQIATGACGITCQKIAEAEVMADAGVDDIFITNNILGGHKLSRVAGLARRCRIAVVADGETVIEGLSAAMAAAGLKLDVAVECDTGGRRCGVQTPASALALAQVIDRAPGLRFGGLMTYPPAGGRILSAAFLAEATDLCRRAGLAVDTVSSGGTPDMWIDDGLERVTEYRAGTYVYNDRSLVARGTARSEDCALTVLTTVVSRPTSDRAIVDAGSKSLTSDLLGLEGYGAVRQFEAARIAALSEEHGHIDLSACEDRPAVGERVHILPNHVCPVSNLVDTVVLVRGDEVVALHTVDARGCVQ